MVDPVNELRNSFQRHSDDIRRIKQHEVMLSAMIDIVHRRKRLIARLDQELILPNVSVQEYTECHKQLDEETT